MLDLFLAREIFFFGNRLEDQKHTHTQHTTVCFILSLYMLPSHPLHPDDDSKRKQDIYIYIYTDICQQTILYPKSQEK